MSTWPKAPRTFEEACQLLNEGRTDEVAEAMKEWHPAILGQMIRAVHKAKNKRSLSPHPDYYTHLEKALSEEMAKKRNCGNQKEE